MAQQACGDQGVRGPTLEHVLINTQVCLPPTGYVTLGTHRASLSPAFPSVTWGFVGRSKEVQSEWVPSKCGLPSPFPSPSPAQRR